MKTSNLLWIFFHAALAALGFALAKTALPASRK